MITALKIFLGCRGTWFWACRKMIEGKTVYRLRDSGIVKFTYEKGIRKIKALIWWETSVEPHEWGVSMEDVFATDFRLVHKRMNLPEIHRQTQMKCDSKSLKSDQLKKQSIGCFATVTGNSTNHRFPIGAMVVVMSQNGTYAYVKGSGGSIGDYVLITDLKDDTI